MYHFKNPLHSTFYIITFFIHIDVSFGYSLISAISLNLVCSFRKWVGREFQCCQISGRIVHGETWHQQNRTQKQSPGLDGHHVSPEINSCVIVTWPAHECMPLLQEQVTLQYWMCWALSV